MVFAPDSAAPDQPTDDASLAMQTVTAPQLDVAASLEFLRTAQPAGPWSLASKNTHRSGMIVRTFGTDDADRLRAWLASEGGHSNIYYHVNRVAPTLAKKADRSDVVALTHLHVDIDPRAGEDFASERARIRAALAAPPDGIPIPTFIVDSGGGFQGVWVLAEPLHIGGDLDAAEDAKLYNVALERAFGADSCHNVDRLLRLPGTVNRPDARKLAKGRVEAAARLVAGSGAAYPISAFLKAQPDTAGAAHCVGGAPRSCGQAGGEITAERLASVDDLPATVPDWCRVLIVQGHDPDASGKYPSRSEAVFAVCCELVRCDVPDGLALGILTDPDLRISESVLEKKGAAGRYARRQIARAREIVSNDYERADNGAPTNTPANVRLAIARLGVTLSYDEFSRESVVEGLSGLGPRLEDAELRRMYNLVRDAPKADRIKVGYDEFARVAIDAARRDAFHPVRDHFDALAWDGVPRLDSWLPRLTGADDTPFNRAAGAAALLGAVQRIYCPGAKHDEMLVLEGPQGCGKSSAVRILAMRDEWFGEAPPLTALGAKQMVEATSGKLFVEVPELSGLRRAQIEDLKSMLSRQTDEARMAYERMVSRVPRQFVFVGTTNADTYLRDPTGARRFHPVRVSQVDLPSLRDETDQLWAEAVARHREGDTGRLDPALYAAAAIQQGLRRERDAWEDAIDRAYGTEQGKVSSEAIWQLLGVKVADRDQHRNERLGSVMRALGFEHKRMRFGAAGLLWGYVRGPSSGAIQLLASEWEGDRDRPF